MDPLNNDILRRELKKLFGSDQFEIIIRPYSFVFKRLHESRSKIERLILLPPLGFTGNAREDLNPHPEGLQATVKVLGAIKQGRKGLSFVRDAISFRYQANQDAELVSDSLNVTIDNTHKNYRESVKSSKEIFYVLKESGEGFYHSLLNLRNEWMLLELQKYLRPSKTMNLEPLFENFSDIDRPISYQFVNTLFSVGDRLFVQFMDLVEKFEKLPALASIQLLIELLNTYNNGKHERCTVVAMLLRIGKRNSDLLIKEIERSLFNNSAPQYFLDEIKTKIVRYNLTRKAAIYHGLVSSTESSQGDEDNNQ